VPVSGPTDCAVVDAARNVTNPPKTTGLFELSVVVVADFAPPTCSVAKPDSVPPQVSA
jgi:hypothetical protein